jgi:Xaa-Pro aminopeptidase
MSQSDSREPAKTAVRDALHALGETQSISVEFLANVAMSDQLRPLIAGVISAPPAADTQAWLALVPRRYRASKADRASLLALAASMRAEMKAIVPPPAAERLSMLRAELTKRGLDGFIVPHADEHQCEYTPATAERLAWLTGFTGSAGSAIVLADKAAVFVDGRYTLQVTTQTDPALYQRLHIAEVNPRDWIASNLKTGMKLGFDSWLHTPAQHAVLEAAVTQAGGTLVAVEGNPVDTIWSAQPAQPIAPIVTQPFEFSGQHSSEKVKAIADKLQADKLDAVVLTTADSIAWLLNIRGGDVACSPLPLSFAIVTAQGKVQLFCDPRKLTRGLKAHMGKSVRTFPKDVFAAALDRLGKKKANVLVDPTNAAIFVFNRLEAAGAKITRGTDPCKLPKACKNAVEVQGLRACHIRDGAALTRGIAWLKLAAMRNQLGDLTEIAVEERLHALRREVPLYRDLSFPSIVGHGPNGAIVHYHAESATNRRLEKGTLVLIDSGGQYQDGTTDVTRTLAIGKPTAELRDRFTRVLKGHVALARARFPKGTTGHALDVLARQPLWEAGLNFDHGTGHGVGSYLGVHEGPQNIGTGPVNVALQPGMICSNEPGFYKSGEYGIRIESLVVVTAPSAVAGGERDMLGFETITMAPIDRDLIDVSLLTAAEIAWIDGYHTQVLEKLWPLLKSDLDTGTWLLVATRPLLQPMETLANPDAGL